MPPDSHPFDFQKLLRLFTRDEVKTPLSLIFKAIAYLTAIWIALPYSPLPSDAVTSLMKFAVYGIIFICLVVLVFAWFRPRHLVYGEAGHRAERKLEYGTDKKVINAEQLADLPPVEDLTQLPENGDMKQLPGGKE
jgi:hypothetical protein